jgi:excisionase family DNA binding protein
MNDSLQKIIKFNQQSEALRKKTRQEEEAKSGMFIVGGNPDENGRYKTGCYPDDYFRRCQSAKSDWFAKITGTPTQAQKKVDRAKFTSIEWMGIKEAAVFLGNVSTSLVDRLRKKGKITWAQIGGRVLLKRASVEAYLAAQLNETAPADEEEVLKEVVKQGQGRKNKNRKPATGFRCLLPPP